MPQTTTSGKRGRPPGTGKNDTDRLLKIAALMAADPALKPTTAIKQIGETDPSTIRRLRDKYNEQQAVLMTATAGALGAPNVTRHLTAPEIAAPLVAAEIPAPFMPATAMDASKPATTVTALVPVPPPVAKARIADAEIDFEPLFKPAPVQDPFMILGKWFGNGIETAAVLFEQQMMFAQTMLKAAPMKAVWRQQIVATEYLLMLSGPGQRIASPQPNNG